MQSSGMLVAAGFGRLRVLVLALTLALLALGALAAGPLMGIGEAGAAEAASAPIRNCKPFTPHAMTGFPQRGGTLVMCPH